MKFITRCAVFLFILVSGLRGAVTPFNSWRALIVFTNATDSLYSTDPDINMYEQYYASVFDALNQVYEASDVNIRAQIAGVIWDKTYAASNWGAAINDLTSKQNGMQRWTSDSILNKYGADAVILVHHVNGTNVGGAASGRNGTNLLKYAPLWLKTPNNPELFAHEIGHDFSNRGNGDHCYSGHRRTFDAVGKEVGGALPDTISLVLGGGGDGIPDDIVETAVRYAHNGFYTTMAYASGSGSSGTYPCYPVISHTYGGVSRTFSFQHQGVGWGLPGGNDWVPQWTGAYSNPSVYWTDTTINTSYPTGGNSIVYLNRLKYLTATSTSYQTTTSYQRNFADTLDRYADTIINLRGIPANIVVTPAMSLGQAGADSQWVYAHLAATSQVKIKPGFRVNTGSSLRISIGESGGMLARRSSGLNQARTSKAEVLALPSRFKMNYEHLSQVLALSLSEQGSRIVVEIYDLRGILRKSKYFVSKDNGTFVENLPLAELPNGVYNVRVIAKNQFRHRFIKW